MYKSARLKPRGNCELTILHTVKLDSVLVSLGDNGRTVQLEKDLYGLLLCQLHATTLISLLLNLGMHIHYVTIQPFLKCQLIVMDVVMNSSFNMLRTVIKADLLSSAIMKYGML